jgi:hypothetical protein
VSGVFTLREVLDSYAKDVDELVLVDKEYSCNPEKVMDELEFIVIE